MTSPKLHLLWILEHLVLTEEFHGTSVLQTRSQVDFSSLVKNFGSSYSYIAGKENQIKGRSQDFPPNFFPSIWIHSALKKGESSVIRNTGIKIRYYFIVLIP